MIDKFALMIDNSFRVNKNNSSLCKKLFGHIINHHVEDYVSYNLFCFTVHLFIAKKGKADQFTWSFTKNLFPIRVYSIQHESHQIFCQSDS